MNLLILLVTVTSFSSVFASQKPLTTDVPITNLNAYSVSAGHSCRGSCMVKVASMVHSIDNSTNDITLCCEMRSLAFSNVNIQIEVNFSKQLGSGMIADVLDVHVYQAVKFNLHSHLLVTLISG